MNINSCIIIIDERRVGGMLEIARSLGGQVLAIVVGARSLADTVCEWGFDKIICFEATQNIPEEAYAKQVAEAAAAADPRLILASDMPVSRVLLGAAAARLNAAIISNLRNAIPEGENIVVSRSIAEDKLLEDIEVTGVVAGIFDGDDVEITSTQPIPLEIMGVEDIGETLQLVETLEAEDSGGLLSASRVVSVGAGLSAKDDLRLIEELAQAAHAEIACSLPVCDDLRWLTASRVVGSSHNQIAPDLYLAVAVSGQPQHLSGVRDAKIVVAINNDPEARILKNCHYGIVGDLYKIVPALVEAFQNID